MHLQISLQALNQIAHGFLVQSCLNPIRSGSAFKESKQPLERWISLHVRGCFPRAIERYQSQNTDEFAKVVNYIQNNGKFTKPNIAKCLSGADPWLVAYAMASQGKIATFEAPAPKSKAPKIPDVANEFDIKCINLWDMLDILEFRSR